MATYPFTAPTHLSGSLHDGLKQEAGAGLEDAGHWGRQHEEPQRERVARQELEGQTQQEHRHAPPPEQLVRSDLDSAERHADAVGREQHRILRGGRGQQQARHPFGELER